MSAERSRDDVAFPVLSASELDDIRPFGVEEQVAAGRLLFQAGEASWDLFVLLEGQAEVLRLDSRGRPSSIATYGPGGFAGELNLLTGQRRSLSCRVTEAGRVLVIAETEFRRLMSAQPGARRKRSSTPLSRGVRSCEPAREPRRSGSSARATRRRR